MKYLEIMVTFVPIVHVNPWYARKYTRSYRSHLYRTVFVNIPQRRFSRKPGPFNFLLFTGKFPSNYPSPSSYAHPRFRSSMFEEMKLSNRVN